MSQNPEQIRQEIEDTRRAAEATLGEIEDRVAPSNIIERKKDQARSRLSDAKRRVMGTVEDAKANVTGTVDDAKGTTDDLKDGISKTADRSSEAAQRQVKGRPLGAGLIAFGLGALAGSLLPTTRAEERAARQIDELLAPAKADLADAGADLAQNLREEAQDALQQAKGEAQEAIEEVKEDTQSAAQEVKGEAQGAAQEVADAAGDAADGNLGGAEARTAEPAYVKRPLKELRQLAADRAIAGRSSMSKQDLADALHASEAIPAQPTRVKAVKSAKAPTPDGDRAPGPSTRSRPRYEERTVKELRELAADRGIVGRSSMSKQELIAALRR